jgi:hypothetical protein
MRRHRLGRLYSVLFLRHVELLREQDRHCEQIAPFEVILEEMTVARSATPEFPFLLL